MKYNGQEVTSDFISEVMSRSFKNTEEIYPSAKEVYAVLQAAEEVWQELFKLEKGDTVTHKKHKDLGRGEVLGISKSGKSADVAWPEVSVSYVPGYRYISTFRIENLTKVEED